MTSNTTNVEVNGRTFRIKETKWIHGDRIISHTFKMGGEDEHCVDATIFYGPDNQPTHGKIPYIEHSDGCAIGSTLDRGSGTILMCKTLLKHIHKKYPSVRTFKFDDMSHIECATEEEQKIASRYQRKKGTKVKPLNLYHLSIAYNGCTWYEKYFGARLENADQYRQYQERVRSLTRPEDKVDFITFVQMAMVPKDQFEYLEKRYEQSSTYREFFESIPKKDRCMILYPWITTFMTEWLGNTFTNTNWVIDITTMPSQRKQQGGRHSTRKNSTYYLPKGRIINYTEKHIVDTMEDTP